MLAFFSGALVRNPQKMKHTRNLNDLHEGLVVRYTITLTFIQELADNELPIIPGFHFMHCASCWESIEATARVHKEDSRIMVPAEGAEIPDKEPLICSSSWFGICFRS